MTSDVRPAESAISEEAQRLLTKIGDEFTIALDMARDSRKGEAKRYGNPWQDSNYWLSHAESLLRMRGRVLGEEIPEWGQDIIKQLQEELEETRQTIVDLARHALGPDDDENDAPLKLAGEKGL